MKLTLGVTTYNVERYLPLAFESVLAQDFTDFEVVVCDNQSTDRTWEICREYAARDPRFRIHRNDENLGEAGNFARVVSLARGEYFRLTAHDDLMAPTLLSECVAVLDADPGVVCAYPQTVIIDADGNPISDWDDRLDLTDPSPVRRLAHFARRWSLLNELFGVIRTDALRNTKLLGQYLSSDARIVAELVLQGRFQVVPSRLFYRRMHPAMTFGGDRTDVMAHHEPRLAMKARKAARRARPGADHQVLIADVMRTFLATADAPLTTRVAGAATFGAVAQSRRARIRLGRLRRRVTGGVLEKPPWENADGSLKKESQ
ncbi:glycosyltransferase family 2 protein [Catenuloplanes indicus]|uniref:Glycosyltransferase involved in cell wall biosynthesis n=1 Tax=Catenuloplanes indicus TaxID=137267 RepID=A0AAE4AZV2_9ACTN|nr:glycosyltransferase family A protein [Catenuloplanes indicus]MDQ0368867.1 glycosyltransferase involved in cell wall biosynthesis [Catenuloplanes indicus]